MCVTDFDLDLQIAEAEDEQAPRPGRHLIGGRRAGVAWGLAEGRDDQDPAKAADPVDAAGAAMAAGARSR